MVNFKPEDKVKIMFYLICYFPYLSYTINIECEKQNQRIMQRIKLAGIFWKFRKTIFNTNITTETRIDGDSKAH